MASQLPAYLSPAPPPLQDFPPLGAGSPPGQEFFRGDGRPPQNNMNGNGNPQRMSGGDWRSNASNAGKAIPSGPHHSNTSNPGHRPFGSGQSFDGPRSPPNAKSEAAAPIWKANTLTQACFRYGSCSLQILQTWPVSSWKSLPLLTLDRCFQVRATLQILLQGTLHPSLSGFHILTDARETVSLGKSVLCSTFYRMVG